MNAEFIAYCTEAKWKSRYNSEGHWFVGLYPRGNAFLKELKLGGNETAQKFSNNSRFSQEPILLIIILELLAHSCMRSW